MQFRLAAVVLFGLASAFSLCAAERRAGVVTMEVDLSAQEPGAPAALWIPYPVSDQDQLIGGIRVQGDFAESGVYTDRARSVPMLFARWDKTAASRKLTFSFSVERNEIPAVELADRAAAWNPSDYAAFLAPSALAPTDGKVKELAGKITQGKESVLSKIRAIYDWTCDNMRRDPQTRGCGTGDVCALLQAPAGKCADIHSVVVALAHAAGIPAREVYGLRLPKTETQDLTSWQHCWAEFFLPGHGWVPVDPADVLKLALVENLPVTDPKVAAARERLFGGLDCNRVKMNIGRDVVLNPHAEGQPLSFFMYPVAQIGGKTLNSLDPAKFRYTIRFTAAK